jgi:hypothetical protein
MKKLTEMRVRTSADNLVDGYAAVPDQTANAKQAPTTYISLSCGEHIKGEHSLWVVLLIIFIIFISSVVVFVLGCAARIALTLHLETRPTEGSPIPRVDIMNASHVNMEAAAAAAPLSDEMMFLKPTTGYKPCYEALVHPGMLTHSNPKVKSYHTNAHDNMYQIFIPCTYSDLLSVQASHHHWSRHRCLT